MSNQYFHIRLKLPFKELAEYINYFGWSCEEDLNNDYPYNTKFWVLSPVTENHIKSDSMKKFLYACDYYDIKIDSNLKKIFVYV